MFWLIKLKKKTEKLKLEAATKIKNSRETDIENPKETPTHVYAQKKNIIQTFVYDWNIIRINLYRVSLV